ncbi:cytochrome c oxidase subunit 6A1, mitochondrial-like [Onthophagus taurus]|uniref:cytochrome c oxidase subunit 6A1, mitochondrial-like n=1 Tax=Onthophagus taurus TaxID=166361 RepID=UPI000C20D852|nr:cytochrome c oxidase subunit 6A1, mitochondrial-like [Onthophagus taurus]
MNRILSYIGCSRFVSTTSYKGIEQRPVCSHEGEGKGNKFRIISLIAVPVIIGLTVLLVVYREEKKRIKFVKYPHMRIRSKRFPWGDGDKSLFHNPRYNALSEGYECPDPLEESEGGGGDEGGEEGTE